MDDTKTLREYARKIERALVRGDATERTHYAALKTLLEGLEKGVTATTEPKRIECGAPDFRVSRGQTMVGYVEAKDVGTSLDAIEKDAARAKPGTQEGKQLKRYLESLANLVFTDFLEFRWYVDGQPRGGGRLGTTVHGGKVALDKAGAEGVLELFDGFYALKMPSAGTPQELAERMSRLARMIRDATELAFGQEAEGGTLHGQLAAFRETLLPDLTAKDFADMYAQTIAYGLFAARTMWDGSGTFTRQNAAWLLPKTNPFLRSLFSEIAGPDLDDRIAWVVDDLAQLLGEADMAAVLQDFGKRAKKDDVVVHFYETFLKEYDPKMREMRGVYYTPEPVVSYIVRSVDFLLRERFGRPLGLADGKTLILDPAVGTGTFLYTAIKLIRERLKAQGQSGSWNDYVASHLLPRLFGFEILMAPYAIAHLKLGMVLQELGYEFGSDQRLGVYLTNTLEDTFKQPQLTLGKFILEEADAAAEIKKVKPIMVVLGNPPYSVSSLNRGRWIQNLLKDYKKNLHEKKLNIDDDYVKFIRFGQWRIERTGRGILAFITNHSYLDNPTFRRMRESLMETFTDIFVFDLHGNVKKKERAPGGGVDKNVFDIQQGVAIAIFVKEEAKEGRAVVRHADLWGGREGKYQVLAETDVKSTDWSEFVPKPPLYLFKSRDEKLLAEYEQGWVVTDIFPVNGSGLNTDRDELCFDFDKAALAGRMKVFFSGEFDDAFRERYRIRPSSSYDVERKRDKCSYSEDMIRQCLYRPYDERWLYYQPGFTSRPVFHVMGNMLRGENLGLVTARQSKEPFAVLATRKICAHKIVTVYDRSSLFPLWIYPEEGQLDKKSGRHANLHPRFVTAAAQRLGLSFVEEKRGDLAETLGAEDIFYYAYAVFHSHAYRSRYAEFLKTDFPRLPLSSDKKLFAALVDKGSQLVALHLRESPALGNVVTKFPVGGASEVEKVQYAEEENRVWINGAQYFEGLEPEVWAFHIGGYRVCEKWLKDRKGRKLSYDDVAHYQKIVVAIKETMRLMAEIDAVIPGWPIE